MRFIASMNRAAWGLALVATLSACGGGSNESMSAADITANKFRQVSSAPVADAALCAAGSDGYTLLDGQCVPSSNVLGAISPIKRTTATTTITADQLFAWAQTTFPTLFPGTATTQTGGGFVFRTYSSGNAIGVTTTLAGLPAGTVLVLGPFTGNQLLTVGTLSSLNCAVAPGNCNTNPNPGTGGSGNYAECYSGSLALTPGHNYQIDTQTSSNGAVQQNISTKYTVNNQTTFHGNTAIELKLDTTVSGQSNTTKLYVALTGDFYSTYGGVSSTAIPGFGSFDITMYNDPAIKTPVNLQSGQTYTVNTTQRFETNNALFNSFLPAPFSYTYTFVFQGKETVTTPAGTFSACKTSTTSVSGTTPTQTTSWIVAEGRYKGLFLKSDDGKGGVSVATKLLFDGS